MDKNACLVCGRPMAKQTEKCEYGTTPHSAGIPEPESEPDEDDHLCSGCIEMAKKMDYGTKHGAY